MPVQIKAGRASRCFEADEHVRPDGTGGELARLNPAFIETAR